jgi:hypothetical protein
MLTISKDASASRVLRVLAPLRIPTRIAPPPPLLYHLYSQKLSTMDMGAMMGGGARAPAGDGSVPDKSVI